MAPFTSSHPKAAFLTGLTHHHLCGLSEAGALGVHLHLEVVEPLGHLQRDARAQGFDLRINSGFRSFEHQLSIWNRKAMGELPVLDSDAVPLDIGALDDRELAFAILRWSALPGASRHHWGTDLDVHDEAARPLDYEIELTPEEVEPGGMFGPLHEWLDERIAKGEAHGFFRPYDRDRGGVAPERWHLSYAPLAADYLGQLTSDVLREVIGPAPMALSDVVLANLDEIYERFVANVNPTVP
jgi:LAS superfamily LD-carboxypeptidase LdcB